MAKAAKKKAAKKPAKKKRAAKKKEPPKQKKARLEKEQAEQQKRFKEHKPGHPERSKAKQRLAKIAVALDRVNAEVKELIDRARRRRIDWNGCPPVGNRRVRKLARMVTEDPLCYITATTNGAHATTSWHYLKKALDWGSSDPTNRAEGRLADRMLARFGARFFLELFSPNNWYVKNGVKYSGQFPDHEDHGHGAA